MPINAQATNLSNKIGIGYGTAQVPQASATGGNIAGDIRAARAQEDAKKAAKKKADTPDIIKAEKLLPAFRAPMNEYLADYYKNYPDWDDATRVQKESEAREMVSFYGNLSAQGQKANDALDPGKNIIFGGDEFEKLYNSDLYKGIKLGDIDSSESYNAVNGLNQVAYTNFETTVIPKLQGIVKHNESTGKTEWLDPETGNYVTSETKQVTQKEADQAIRGAVASDPSITASALQDAENIYGKDSSEYKKYEADPAQFYIDKYSNQLLKNWKGSSITEPKGGSGYSKVGYFEEDERDMNVMSPTEESGLFGSSIKAQAVKTQIKGSFTPSKKTYALLPEGYTLNKLKPIEEGEDWGGISETVEVGTNEWIVEGINIVPVFKKGAKGKKGTDIGGRLVDKDIMNDPEFKDQYEWSPVVVFKVEYEGQEDSYAPLDEIEGKVAAGFGKYWEDIKGDIYAKTDSLNNKETKKEETKELKGSKSQLEAAAKSNNLTYYEYKKSLEDQGYTIVIQ